MLVCETPSPRNLKGKLKSKRPKHLSDSQTWLPPRTRSTAPKKVRLTQTQVAIAKKLGVPLELYAQKVAEEMRKI